jgi:hypothetical protein
MDHGTRNPEILVSSPAGFALTSELARPPVMNAGGVNFMQNSDQIAGEQKVIANAIRLVRAFPLGHAGHWDRSGNHGRSCPLCLEQDKAIRELLEALQEAAVRHLTL